MYFILKNILFPKNILYAQAYDAGDERYKKISDINQTPANSF